MFGLIVIFFCMGMGWVYYYYYYGFVRGDKDVLFKKCIFELLLCYMIKNGYLMLFYEVDVVISYYDFLLLLSDLFGWYSIENMNVLLKDNIWVIKVIIK